MAELVTREQFDAELTATGDKLAAEVAAELKPLTDKLNAATNDPAVPLDFTQELTTLNGIGDKIKAVFAPPADTINSDTAATDNAGLTATGS